MDNFDDLLPRLDALQNFLPKRLGLDLLNEIPATLKFTSASSSAIRTSRKASPALDSEIFPSPRKLRKAFCNFWLKPSNMPAI